MLEGFLSNDGPYDAYKKSMLRVPRLRILYTAAVIRNKLSPESGLGTYTVLDFREPGLNYLIYMVWMGAGP